MGAAVLTESAFEIGFALARDTEFHAGFVAFSCLLVVAAGVVCAAAGALLPGGSARAALALFTALHGFAEPMPLSIELLAAAMALACWWLLAPQRVRGISAGAQGVIVATALCVALVLLSFGEAALSIPDLVAWQGWLTTWAVFASCIAVATVWERTRPPRLPSAAVMCAVALMISLCGTAYAYGLMRSHPIALKPAVSAPAEAPPDVFVLVLDTVRADHLSSYGYERDTTPNLTRLLREQPGALQYDLAFSPASWTVPSHASLLTGTMPSQHRARSNGEDDDFLRSMTTISMVAEETLPEALGAAGYCTVAVLANVNLLRVDGLQRGFEAFVQPPRIRRFRMIASGLRKRFLPAAFSGHIKPYPSAGAVNDTVLEMQERCDVRPTFVLANYMEAHSPYLPPAPYQGMFAGEHPPTDLGEATLADSDETVALKRARYDEELRYLDARIGELFAQLEADGSLQRSWIFVTSDHGEAFREHGTSSHGTSVYNEQVRIPLIVKPPRGVTLAPTDAPVSLVDVTATIAAVAGRDGFGVGADLRRELPQQRSVAIEFRGGVRHDVQAVGVASQLPARSTVRGRWKLIERDGSFELYDLAADPRERANRELELPELVQALAPALPDLRIEDTDASHGRRDPGEFGRDEEETLRALGYVE